MVEIPIKVHFNDCTTITQITKNIHFKTRLLWVKVVRAPNITHMWNKFFPVLIWNEIDLGDEKKEIEQLHFDCMFSHKWSIKIFHKFVYIKLTCMIEMTYIQIKYVLELFMNKRGLKRNLMLYIMPYPLWVYQIKTTEKYIIVLQYTFFDIKQCGRWKQPNLWKIVRTKLQIYDSSLYGEQ